VTLSDGMLLEQSFVGRLDAGKSRATVNPDGPSRLVTSEGRQLGEPFEPARQPSVPDRPPTGAAPGVTVLPGTQTIALESSARALQRAGYSKIERDPGALTVRGTSGKNARAGFVLGGLAGAALMYRAPAAIFLTPAEGGGYHAQVGVGSNVTGKHVDNIHRLLADSYAD
jgi:hypothetical protein